MLKFTIQWNGQKRLVSSTFSIHLVQLSTKSLREKKNQREFGRKYEKEIIFKLINFRFKTDLFQTFEMFKFYAKSFEISFTNIVSFPFVFSLLLNFWISIKRSYKNCIVSEYLFFFFDNNKYFWNLFQNFQFLVFGLKLISTLDDN